MISNRKFGVIGGDLRQLYLAKKLQNDSNEVFICGFEKSLEPDKLNLKTLKLDDLISQSEYIVLPVPTLKGGTKLNAPFSGFDINIDEKFLTKIENKVVFGGIVSSLFEDVNKHSFFVANYYNREDFTLKNAVLTAEGAVQVALSETKEVIFGKKCLVIGYGRIGKVLSTLLKGMGAKVVVSARSGIDRTLASLSGFGALDISKSCELLRFDLVFNTVPALVLGEKALRLLKTSSLVVDLASAPGGTDKKAAKDLGVKVVHALGIPGRLFPKSAGEIVADTIYKIIQEEKL